MKLQGKIKLIGETKSFGAKNFLKRELVITTEEQYPQTILIEFVQDKTKVLDNFSLGQEVEVGINLRGREWTNPEGQTKYFNTIQGWSIQLLSKAQPEIEEQENNKNEDERDDLPF